jgi:hypothetical protein
VRAVQKASSQSVDGARTPERYARSSRKCSVSSSRCCLNSCDLHWARAFRRVGSLRFTLGISQARTLVRPAEDAILLTIAFLAVLSTRRRRPRCPVAVKVVGHVSGTVGDSDRSGASRQNDVAAVRTAASVLPGPHQFVYMCLGVGVEWCGEVEFSMCFSSESAMRPSDRQNLATPRLACANNEFRNGLYGNAALAQTYSVHHAQPLFSDKGPLVAQHVLLVWVHKALCAVSQIVPLAPGG